MRKPDKEYNFRMKDLIDFIQKNKDDKLAHYSVGEFEVPDRPMTLEEIGNMPVTLFEWNAIPRVYIMIEGKDGLETEDFDFNMLKAVEKGKEYWNNLSDEEKKTTKISVILCRKSMDGDWANLDDGYTVVSTWT